MLCQTPDELLKRARRLRAALARLPGLDAQIADGVGYAGGGTLPEPACPPRPSASARPLWPSNVSPRASVVTRRRSSGSLPMTGS